jgi:monoterpene epsilon-lactone hydrolase
MVILIYTKAGRSYLSYNSFLSNAAGAYADLADQKNPYVSPVYGNFTRGYSPTLIQDGTREIFPSDFIRSAQALDQADIPVKLDIHEGRSHVNQNLLGYDFKLNKALIIKFYL